MTKISRNAPCPCGSGKKYKKCCLQNDLNNAAKSKKPESPTADESATEEHGDMEEIYKEAQELDDLSNSVIDLIQAKNFDAAQDVCKQLLETYPDQVDGLERMAMLYEAKGNKEKAALYHRKTTDFMMANGGFDPESIVWHKGQATRFEQG